MCGFPTVIRSGDTPESGRRDAVHQYAAGWLEYSDASRLPPSRWDNGIPGLLFDYNINGTVNKPHKGKQSQSLSYNGTAGANFGARRLRADYQGNLNHTTGSGQGTDSQFTRAVSTCTAPSRAGAQISHWVRTTSILRFSAPRRYTGASLESDDRMLPPKLRGYAPQVSGIADTNARVVISQQGRILYDSTVPAGPFTIQDWTAPCVVARMLRLSSRTGGKKRSVDTAYVPYLTRPGGFVTGWFPVVRVIMNTPWRDRFLLPVRHPGYQ